MSIETRNFNGYFQSREVITENGKTKRYPWQFYISGFCSDALDADGLCHVLMFDKTYSTETIDKDNNLIINGKKYSHQYWEH